MQPSCCPYINLGGLSAPPPLAVTRQLSCQRIGSRPQSCEPRINSSGVRINCVCLPEQLLQRCTSQFPNAPPSPRHAGAYRFLVSYPRPRGVNVSAPQEGIFHLLMPAAPSSQGHYRAQQTVSSERRGQEAASLGATSCQLLTLGKRPRRETNFRFNSDRFGFFVVFVFPTLPNKAGPLTAPPLSLFPACRRSPRLLGLRRFGRRTV